MQLHDAKNLLTNKILSNRVSIECLDKQIELSKRYMQMQALSIKIAQAKKKLVTELSNILEKQLAEFTEERQKETMSLYGQLNKLDTPGKSQIKLEKEIDSLQHQLNQLIKNIEYIESKIPNQTVVNTYNINYTDKNKKCNGT